MKSGSSEEVQKILLNIKTLFSLQYLNLDHKSHPILLAGIFYQTQDS